MRRGTRGLYIGILAILIVAGVAGLRFARGAGLWATITPLGGPCRTLPARPGPEDIVVDRERGVAYVSSTDRRTWRRGGEAAAELRGAILRIDLRGPVEGWALVEVSPPEPASFLPHGIGLFVSGSGERSLFVVNHPPGAPDEVVIFDVDHEGRLRYRRSVADPLLFRLNDVQPAGRDRFYATNDHGKGLPAVLQDGLRLDRASLVYFDGRRARIAAEGLSYANGVNLSRDGRELYVAETTDRDLRVYDRDPESGELGLATVVPVGMGADNVDVQEDGDLLVGGHPKLLDFLRHARDPSAPSPSQVVRVSRKPDGSFRVRTVFMDDGRRISGVAVAAGRGDTMLLGPVFQPKILVCGDDRGRRGS